MQPGTSSRASLLGQSRHCSSPPCQRPVRASDSVAPRRAYMLIDLSDKMMLLSPLVEVKYRDPRSRPAGLAALRAVESAPRRKGGRTMPGRPIAVPVHMPRPVSCRAAVTAALAARRLPLQAAIAIVWPESCLSGDAACVMTVGVAKPCAAGVAQPAKPRTGRRSGATEPGMRANAGEDPVMPAGRIRLAAMVGGAPASGPAPDVSLGRRAGGPDVPATPSTWNSPPCP